MLVPNFYFDRIIPEFKLPFNSFNFRLGLDGFSSGAYSVDSMITTYAPTLIILTMITIFTAKMYQAKNMQKVLK